MSLLQTPLQKAKHIDCQEILIYEIFELIPSEEQRKELELLLDQGDNDKIKWADEILINSLGFNERTKSTEFNIGAHTKWAINEKYTFE